MRRQWGGILQDPDSNPTISLSTRYSTNTLLVLSLLSLMSTNRYSYCFFILIKDPISLPTEAYMAVDEVSKSGEVIQNFIHLPSTVQAIEPEEIGVEQLLREINSMQGHSLTNMVKNKMQALQGLVKKIQQIQKYLQNIISGKVIQNSNILNQLQVYILHYNYRKY